MRKISFLAVFLLLNLCLCPAKLWSNADFAPQNYGAMRTLPRKITEPSFFAPQNHRDFVLCPAKLWSNADFARRNRGDIVSGAKKDHKILLSSFFSNYFCKSLSFPRSLQPFGPLLKEKIFCVMVPLSKMFKKTKIKLLSCNLVEHREEDKNKSLS